MADPDDADLTVLRNKRDATRYQILVEVAERQPAMSQREIADAIGVTSQAVSDYLRDLVEDGHVDKLGRGRYEVTKEGVDWLITQTEALERFVEHVSSDVIGRVEIETAIAATALSAGDPVTVVMRDGVLHAVSGDTGGATAVAVTDADAGGDVGITDFEGVVDYDLGAVTVLVLPRVQDGGSRAVDPAVVRERAAAHDLVAAAGVEALAAARAADRDPDLRFGTVTAVSEAAARGLDVLLLTTPAHRSAHTDELREAGIDYEVVDVD